MGQHICFGAMCDPVANSNINVVKGTLTQKHSSHGHNICHIEHKDYAHLEDSWHSKLV